MLRDQPSPPMPKSPAPIAVPPPTEQLVTLDQIGAMVHRFKRSMERYRGRMPPPRVRVRRGQTHLWAWSEVCPWLEEVEESLRAAASCSRRLATSASKASTWFWRAS